MRDVPVHSVFFSPVSSHLFCMRQVKGWCCNKHYHVCRSAHSSAREMHLWGVHSCNDLPCKQLKGPCMEPAQPIGSLCQASATQVHSLTLLLIPWVHPAWSAVRHKLLIHGDRP